MDTDAKQRKEPMAIVAIKFVLNSRYLVFFTAGFTCAAYFFGWDMVSLYYLVIVGALMLLLLDDFSTFLPHIFFFAIISSAVHSNAAMYGSDYYGGAAIYTQLAILAAILLLAFCYRFIEIARAGTFKPTGVFWGLCVLALAVILAGVGAEGYSALNLAYGALLAFCLLGVYVLFSSSVRLSGANVDKICMGISVFSAALVLELVVQYAQIGTEIGEFIRAEMSYEDLSELFVFGWGDSSAMGLLLNLCIPPMLMISGKYKNGWAMTLCAAILSVAVVATLNPGAILVLIVTYVTCGILAAVKNPRRTAHIITLVAGAAVSAAVFCVLRGWRAFGPYFSALLDSMINIAGDGFAAGPILGAGFFSTFLEKMSIGTLATICAACGGIGILVYSVHRIQTVVAFAEKKHGIDGWIMAMSVAALLLSGLFGCGMMWCVFTAIYSAFLALLCGAGAGFETEEKAEADALELEDAQGSAQIEGVAEDEAAEAGEAAAK